MTRVTGKNAGRCIIKTELKAEDILRKFEILKQDRRNFEPLWQECAWQVAPVLRDWDDEKRKDPYKLPKRITNKPTNYLNTCITGIAGYAMSPNIKWFKLSLDDKSLLERSGVQHWLERCEEVMRRTFERCGFYQKSLHWLEEAAIYGQSAMLIENLHGKDAPLRYSVPEVNELYLDDNETGETGVVYRAYWSDIENVVNHYGLNAMHETIRKTYEDFSKEDVPLTDMSMKLVHAVYLRRPGKPDKDETVGSKKWASVIVDAANKHIIKETGYDEFPYAMFFWEKRGKPYGLSPTMKAVNDIAVFQEAHATLMTVAEYSANPSKNVPETMRGHENFQPGGYNYFRNPEQVASQIDVGTNYPITVQFTETLAQNIKEWYNVDFFLMLRQYENVQNMTATAVAALQGEQTALLSALVSNLYSGLSKIITRTFNILAEKRMFPPMPFALQYSGGPMKIDFLGVLAQAQKAAYEYAGIMDVMQVATAFAEFGKLDPRWAKVINWINPETVFKKAIESRGAPADALRTKDEYEQIVGRMEEQDAAAMEAQTQAQQRQAVLQNAKGLNDPVRPGSILGNIMRGGS